ncbi:MAG: glycosyltransferase family 2 protein [Clostridiales bacterium]|nr:glycosyltransferase family 2 protein [Clostridiales bacterium]
MGKEKVTILMATYNGECYLPAQLESLQQQECKNWKLVVGDDGSSDRTLEILFEFQQKCPNSVEIIKNNPPTGSAKINFMQLLAKADTPYIMFCDQDDIWEPHKVQCTLTYREDIGIDNNIPILVHSDLTVLEENGTATGSFFDYQNLPRTTSLSSLIIQNSVTGCTMMINKSLQERMLQVKDYHKIIMHDYWATLIAIVYGKVGFIENHTMFYRQHANNSVGAKSPLNPLYLVKRLMQGRKGYKEQMEESVMQVSFFMETYQKQYPIEEQKRRLLEEYALLDTRNKFYRMWFYIRNKVYKRGFIRILMQFIWG